MISHACRITDHSFSSLLAKWYRIGMGMRLDSTEFMMIIKKTLCLLQNGICPHSTQSSDRMTEGILYCFGAAARARERVVTISGLDGMVLGAEGQGEGTGGLIKVTVVALSVSVLADTAEICGEGRGACGLALRRAADRRHRRQPRALLVMHDV